MDQGGTLPVQRLRDALSQSYTIDRELGRGGMATVYLAQDSKHDRVVALKVAVDKGFGHREWIDNDPDLKPIRANPKFQAIVDAI